MLQTKLDTWQSKTNVMLDLLRQIPLERVKEAGVCGIWSVQQIVAHLAGWNREALSRFKEYQTADFAPKRYDFDSFNASSIEALSLFNWRETLETYQYTVDDLRDYIQGLLPLDLDPNHFYVRWLDGLNEDLDEHGEQIRVWLKV